MIQNITLSFLLIFLGTTLFAQKTADEATLKLYPFNSKRMKQM
jgi:hypothetical protein